MLCLREDIPHTLDLDHHMSWHIYRADVAFKLPSGQYFMGLSRYKLFLRSMRLLARLFYSDIAVKLGTVWQPNKNTVWIKWQACGAPRFGGDQLCAEAVSTYKFDSEGKIYEHAIDRIVPPDSPLLGLLNLLARLQWNQQQLPGDEGVVVPGIPGGSSTSNCQQLPPDGSIVPGTRDPQ